MGPELELQQSGLGVSDWNVDAWKIATRPVSWPDQLLCSGLIVFLLLSHVHHHNPEGNRSASDELFFPRWSFLRVPPVDGIFGRPRLYPSCVRDLFTRVDLRGCELSAPGGGDPLCCRRGRI